MDKTLLSGSFVHSEIRDKCVFTLTGMVAQEGKGRATGRRADRGVLLFERRAPGQEGRN